MLRGYGAGAVDYLTKPIPFRHPAVEGRGASSSCSGRTGVAQANAALQREIGERHACRMNSGARTATSNSASRSGPKPCSAPTAQDEFLASLAHELRNPLAPIRSAVELLQHGNPAEEQADARAPSSCVNCTK
jgi:signal transduction histidine kinase